LDNFTSALASSNGSLEELMALSSAAFSDAAEYRFIRDLLIGRKKLSAFNICTTNSFNGSLLFLWWVSCRITAKSSFPDK
jgi:hypothetical protein